MRILHVIRGLVNSSGPTHIVGPLAEAQARQGHTVTVYFVEKPGQTSVVPDPSLVTTVACPMSRPHGSVAWSWTFATSSAEAVRRADTVHIHMIWNFPAWLAMRESHRAGVPFVVAPQGSLEEWALGRKRRLKAVYGWAVEKPYFNRAAAMQALTPVEAEQCRQFGIAAPVVVLPNGVDLETLDAHPVADPVDVSPPPLITFLFVGRVFPKKGLDLLIPAFAQLAVERPDVRLLIAGGDAGTGYRRQMQDLVRQHGVTDAVTFVGEVRGQKKFDLLRRSDVFVLSSYSEGLPVAVLEAMACSKPVVVTRNCNLDEVNDGRAGWVVEPTVQSVLSGLRAAAASRDERSRRGGEARHLIETRYNWSTIARASIQIYAGLRTGPNSRKSVR